MLQKIFEMVIDLEGSIIDTLVCHKETKWKD
jgi:hypothetical protein